MQRHNQHFLHMELQLPPPLYSSYVSPEQAKQDQHQDIQHQEIQHYIMLSTDDNPIYQLQSKLPLS